MLITPAPVFDYGIFKNWSRTRAANDWNAQANHTIFRVLQQGVDYNPGAQFLNLYVAAPAGFVSTKNFVNNYDYTLAVFPVV